VTWALRRATAPCRGRGASAWPGGKILCAVGFQLITPGMTDSAPQSQRKGNLMGKHARIGLLLGASACLLAVMVDWVIEDLNNP
jgi:hypothetical protein